MDVQTQKTYQVINRMPLQAVFEMQMPAEIRERLEQRMNSARAKMDPASRNLRMKTAQEKASAALISRIQKAEAHHAKVTAVREQRREQLSLAVADNTGAALLASSAEATRNLGAKKLQFQNRMERAAARREQQIWNRIQAAKNAQVKFYIPPEKKAEDLASMKQRQQEKLERAEAKRNELKQAKLQKAKDAQEKFLVREVAEERRMQRAKSQSLLEQIQADYSKLDATSKHYYHFYKVDQEVERQKRVKAASAGRKKGIAFDLGFDDMPQQSQPKQAKNKKMNINMPLAMDMQVPNKASKPETMQMNEQRTMVVNGNKLTFNIAITVNVEPVE